MKPTVKLLKAQAEFITATTPRYIGYVSGFRGGKTYSLAHKAIYLASKNLNLGVDGALMEPTRDMNRRILYPTMTRILDEIRLPYTYRGSDAPCFILHFPHGDFTIWLLSSETAESRARGLSLCFAGLDEFDTLKINDAKACWDIMVSRLTRGNIMQLFITSTPEGFNWMNWFFNEDVIKEDGSLKTDRLLITSSSEDNPFIDSDYCDNLRAQYPKKLCDAYIHGKFVNLSTGSVYYCFDRALNATTKTVEQHPKHVLHIGIDFNVGKMSATTNIIENDITYAIDEFYGAQNTEALINEIKKRYPGRVIYCYPDSSGKSEKSNASITDIQLLINAGFVVKYQAKNPLVVDRIGSVNARLCNSLGIRRLFVNIQKCPRLVKTLEQQGFNDKGEPDKSGDLDHPADGVGYFIWYCYPIRGKGKVTSL